LDENVAVRRLATDFVFTEGPIWHPKEQYLLFSDIPAAIRRRWDKNGVREVLNPSNKGNGMTYDRALNLLVCEHSTSSVARFSDDRREVLASHFEGKELNSPNDIAAAADGAIWFTDPSYGRMPVYGVERPCQLDFRGVYRIPPGGGALELVVEKAMFTQPNGLCFSPDEKILYIADTSPTFDPKVSHHITAFDVVDGRALGNRRGFAMISPGMADGFRVDIHGNIFTSSQDSVQVYASDGSHLGKILVPEKVGNLTFGGPGHDRLFIAASSSLYSIDLNTRGVQRP